MKLEKRFEAKKNQLYSIGGAAVTDVSTLAEVVRWSDVEPNFGEYDEAFLAALRDELKQVETADSFVFIEPVCDKVVDSATFAEQVTAAMKHCARRIKDCASVIGFAVPDEFVAGGFAANGAAAAFMEALSQKHRHYVYFCKRHAVIGKNYPDNVVLY